MTDEDHKRMVEWLWEQYKDDLPDRSPRSGMPPLTFRQINPEVRRFLATLDAHDAKELEGIIQSYKNSKVIKGFLRKTALAIIGALTIGAAFGENITSIFKSIFGGGK